MPATTEHVKPPTTPGTPAAAAAAPSSAGGGKKKVVQRDLKSLFARTPSPSKRVKEETPVAAEKRSPSEQAPAAPSKRAKGEQSAAPAAAKAQPVAAPAAKAAEASPGGMKKRKLGRKSPKKASPKRTKGEDGTGRAADNGDDSSVSVSSVSSVASSDLSSSAPVASQGSAAAPICVDEDGTQPAAEKAEAAVPGAAAPAAAPAAPAAAPAAPAAHVVAEVKEDVARLVKGMGTISSPSKHLPRVDKARLFLTDAEKDKVRGIMRSFTEEPLGELRCADVDTAVAAMRADGLAVDTLSAEWLAKPAFAEFLVRAIEEMPLAEDDLVTHVFTMLFGIDAQADADAADKARLVLRALIRELAKFSRYGFHPRNQWTSEEQREWEQLCTDRWEVKIGQLQDRLPAELVATLKARRAARKAELTTAIAAVIRYADPRVAKREAEREAKQAARDAAREEQRKAKEEERRVKQAAKQAAKEAAEEARRAAKEALRKAKEDERKAKEDERERAKQEKLAEKRAREEAREAERKAKEEERRAKEAAKEAERVAKEKAEAEKRAKFASFFKPTAATPRAANKDKPLTGIDAVFLPIPLRPHTILAPIVPRTIDAEARAALDAAVERTKADGAVLPTAAELLAEAKASRRQRRVERDVVPLRADGEAMDVDEDEDEDEDAPRLRFKLFRFADNRRPVWHGTFSKTSKVVRGRRPLARDEQMDYEFDSDDEWDEEEENGEDIDDADEDEEKEEDEEDEDGFLVDDGHLSDGEGVHDEGEQMPAQGIVELHASKKFKRAQKKAGKTSGVEEAAVFTAAEHLRHLRVHVFAQPPLVCEPPPTPPPVVERAPTPPPPVVAPTVPVCAELPPLPASYAVLAPMPVDSASPEAVAALAAAAHALVEHLGAPDPSPTEMMNVADAVKKTLGDTRKDRTEHVTQALVDDLVCLFEHPAALATLRTAACVGLNAVARHAAARSRHDTVASVFAAGLRAAGTEPSPVLARYTAYRAARFALWTTLAAVSPVFAAWFVADAARVRPLVRAVADDAPGSKKMLVPAIGLVSALLAVDGNSDIVAAVRAADASIVRVLTCGLDRATSSAKTDGLAAVAALMPWGDAVVADLSDASHVVNVSVKVGALLAGTKAQQAAAARVAAALLALPAYRNRVSDLTRSFIRALVALKKSAGSVPGLEKTLEPERAALTADPMSAASILDDLAALSRLPAQPVREYTRRMVRALHADPATAERMAAHKDLAALVGAESAL